MQKLYDAVVKTGEYQNTQGETKSRYENVGSVMQGDNGQFLILKRTFNTAGVPNPDNKDSVIVSFFEPQQGNNQSQNSAPQNNQGAQYQGNQYQGQNNNHGGQQQGGQHQGGQQSYSPNQGTYGNQRQ